MKKLFTSLAKAVVLAAALLGTFRASAATVTVSTDISGTVTWRQTNTYLLDGFIYVLNGATLNIEPGTVIKGLNAPTTGESASALFVTRGGKIFAVGTASNPIIFTAEDDDVNDLNDLGIYERGLWGGVVLLGNAPINTSATPAGNTNSPKYDVFEGLPDSTNNPSGQFINRFGGNDPADSSGALRYVSIRHGGFAFLPNKELNGLSMGGVGKGTTIEYVESYAVADDGFEFFGGTVNTRYLVSAFNDDDAFDTDQGWNGDNQYWFAIQEPGRKDSGGEWNGEPNTLAVSNTPLANYTIYNMTLIGAGTNTTANNGLTIREYAAPQLYNSIITDFGGNGVRITDVRSGAFLTNGTLDIRDNIWWNFATNGVPVSAAGSGAALLFSDLNRRNDVVDPQLGGISRTNNLGLDPRPRLTSPALCETRKPPANGFFDQVGFKGAFDSENLWLRGWTFLDKKGFVSTSPAPPAPSPAGSNLVTVINDIASNTSWTRNNIYLLDGFVYVLSGATLSIEPGTVIKGLNAPTTGESASALFVTRGGRISARGTPHYPIIFTAEDDDVNDLNDLGIYERGLWGGVVLLGNAPINTSATPAGNTNSPKYDVFEGLPDSTNNPSGQFVNRFGGSDVADSSGVMCYVSIRHGGFAFLPNKELNGLSMGGVGNGTVIDHVESYAVADDGFEFFGGSVNTRYLVSAFNDDDGFDTDQGWNGKNQFWFAIQEPGRKDSGGEWNGEPNTLAVSNTPLATFTVYNMTLIGAGTNTTANNGLTIREYAAPQLYNSIITDFGGNGVRITDVRSGAFLTNGTLDIRDNIWWNFATNGVPVSAAGTGAALLFSDLNRRNEVVNPQLAGISRTNNHSLDPRPLLTSPALCETRMVPNDGFYCKVGYKGAFNSSEDLWLRHWTFLDAKGFLSTNAVLPGVPASGTNVVTVVNDIAANTTWTRSNIYLLDGFIYVLSGATLSIEPGTVIKGLNAPTTGESASALFVTRGGRIHARGTPQSPIIFTAEDDDVNDLNDLGIYERGLWGGVVLLGNAPINTSATPAGNTNSPKYDVFEGLPDSTNNPSGQFVNRFGGSDVADSSGVMCYVSIRHGGFAFLPNKELNGLSMGGVGNGTVIDHVESYAVADDGFEFFGGSVNTRYLVSAFNDDDGFDTDQGWNGKNQFWFAIQEPGRKDSGGEWNGEPNTLAVSNTPLATFTVYNMTLIGAGTNTTANNGLTIREYAAPQLYNSIITDFGGNGVRITDVRSGAFLTNGTLDIRDNIWWNFATNGVPVSAAGSGAALLFSDLARNNDVVDPLLTSISRTNNNLLDPRLRPGSPALASERVPPVDGFFCQVCYKGAFDANNLWLKGWTFLDAKGFLPVEAVACGQPTLTIVTAGGSNLEISWLGAVGCNYQLQSSPEVGAGAVWTNVGSSVAGTGAIQTLTVVNSGTGDKFYRFEVQ